MLKRSQRNQAEGMMDRVAGRLLEMIGKVTGKKSHGAKGKAARGRGSARTAKGRAKGKAGRARGSARTKGRAKRATR